MIELKSTITEGGYDGMQSFEQALYGHVDSGPLSLEDAMMAATSSETSSCW